MTQTQISKGSRILTDRTRINPAGYLQAWILRIWTQDYGEQIQPVIRVEIDLSASELSNALTAGTHCLD